jgi:APA family basic amino acid/polyamine antiporter
VEKGKRNYGLFTTITMIIGICIGSGIFFKSDNILSATGGNVLLGVIVFVLGATSIIFGGLCISELAARTDCPGGIITYMEEFVNEKFACGMGWFQIFVYYPTVIAVVSWVVGIYICILFGLEGKFEIQMLIGFIYFTFIFVLNSLSAKLGGGFQNFSTVSKMIPLILIAVLGLLFGNPVEGLKNTSASTLGGATWLAAIGPVAFSFDGWTISTSIAAEIRDSKKNLPRALIIAPIFVLLTYVAYFIGVSSLLEPQKIIELQDAHVYVVAERLFGSIGAQIILIFVIIAVMGTVNGIILGYIRLPYSMAIRGNKMFPLSEKLSQHNDKRGVPVNSAIFCYIVTIIWYAIHYVTVKFNILPNSDISEISIVMSYIFYLILYYKVFTLYRKGEIHSIYKGVIVPILATIGSMFILSGGLQNKLFFIYAAICIMVVLISFLYYNSHSKSSKIQ